jgi:hypothetical protein
MPWWSGVGIDDQAPLRLLSRPAEIPTASKSTDHQKQEASVSWDFSKIPVFAPDRANQDRTPSPFVQAKLIIGQVDDPLEHQADRVADQVMRMREPEAATDARATAFADRMLQRKCNQCEVVEEGQIHRKMAGSFAPGVTAPPVVHDVLRSPGQTLDPEARRFMEARFGFDFSMVRVHADGLATQSALAVDARAYAVGKHIVFQTDKFNPGSHDGKVLIAHELAHVVQQEANSVTTSSSSSRLDDSGSSRGSAEQAQLNATPSLNGPTQRPVLQRQRADESQPPTTATAAPGSPAATQSQPATTAATAVPVNSPTAQPGSQWSTEIPYIHFDLLDFYGSYSNPAGPYFYSSYVWKNRADNPNFSRDLNPAPARDTNIYTPAGWHPKPHELNWVFSTKFYVDSAAAPLPKEFTEFETKADIKFVPASGGTGFEEHFADGSPQYVPPLPSFAFPLQTKPSFRAEHPIMESGTLQWDAKLRVAKVNADVPTQLEFSAPAGCPDASAFKRQLERMGTRVKDPAPDEKALLFRVTISEKADGGVVGNVVVVNQDGTPGGVRTIDVGKISCDQLVNALALVVALSTDPEFSQGQFGVSKSGLVEISGAQRVEFEPPKTQP